MTKKRKLKVALIFGGTSQEREVSINSAKMIAPILSKKYQVIPIEVSEEKNWLKKNVNKLDKVDVAFLALHGPGGEDGTIQGLLELLKIPYTGSGVMSSALAMDKARTKRIIAPEGVLVAPHIVLSKINFQKDPKKYLNKLKGKIVIKPNRIGSSIGVTISNNRKEIERGIKKAFVHDEEVMIEPYIAGRELTVPVLGNKLLRALPVIEIVPKVSEFFNYQAKYEIGATDEIVPASISKNITVKVSATAVLVHEILGCRGVTRSDFILTEKGDLYFLEINTIPGMTNNSLVPKSAAALGISFSQLLDKLIQLALNKE